MERDGKTVRTIEHDRFRDPRAVAAGRDGTIYVTDSFSYYGMFKFDNKGNCLEAIQHELKKTFSVKVIQNQLYMTDHSGLVKIFDTNYKIVGTIQTKECPEPYDIAVGEDGLYVVGGCGKIAVYRCARNGEFIRHLNTDPSLNLSGICFDSSGHLFVSHGGGSNGVCVLQPSGDDVASLSLANSRYPAGIAIDEDGFVCV